jgi:hypothetical protein
VAILPGRPSDDVGWRQALSSAFYQVRVTIRRLAA